MTSPANPGPSLLLIEAGMTLLAGVIAVCWPQVGSRSLLRVEKFLGRLARRRRLSVIVVGLVAIIARLAILPVSPIPQPFVHDEFSYLLAADTFASGRLTNPTHPMWKHFESFHITQKPSYMSMYFPAQGMALAVGETLAGNPWYGVWLSAGVMCAAICWMLQGWLPPGWALLGGMLAVMRLALFSYWINGYYGGAVAATGGALVLGSLPRVLRTFQVRHLLLMACGIVILANSRPYEGLLLCVPAVGALLWFTRAQPSRAILIRRMIAPAALLFVAAVSMGYYNYSVFGNVFTLPYQVNRMTYAMSPVFLWQTPRPAPVYRYKVLKDFYTKWELGEFEYARTSAGFVNGTAKKLGIVVSFFFGCVLIVPLTMLPWMFRDRRTRFLMLTGCVVGAGLSLNAWLSPHYVAPFACALYAMLLQAMRHLRFWRPGGQPSGLFLVRIVPMICLMLVAVRLCAEPLHVSLGRWPTMVMWYGTEPIGLDRAWVRAQLESYPGRQLAIVRYSPDHVPFDDWVYNAADIDNAKVVWAREMDPAGATDLIEYFHDRKVWLVEPDMSSSKISPYPMQGGAAGLASLHTQGTESGR